MPQLIQLVAIGGDGAGFLLPVFQAHQGSNHQLVQKVDEHNNVVSFEPILLINTLVYTNIFDFYTDIGRQSIWAFRDENGTIHIGDFKKIEMIGIQLLSDNALKQSPMAAAELVCFCKFELRFPDVLRTGFESLSKHSEASAKTWRDTMVLLPAIKADLTREDRTGARSAEISRVIVVSRGRTSHIYTTLKEDFVKTNITTWRTLADIFGIDELRIHELAHRDSKQWRQRPNWSLLGVGGIARFVIKNSPFFGSLTDQDAPSAGAIVHGSTGTSLFGGEKRKQLLIGIVRSDLNDAQQIRNSFTDQSFMGENEMRHIINVRPIGFGTPSKTKASPEALFASIPNIDALWLVTAHRLRQTGSHWNSLSAINTASRFVRAAARGLISSFQSEDLLYIRNDTKYQAGIGIFGAARYDGNLDFKNNIARVLYSMLCEDAYLHSAQRIIMLWPYFVSRDMRFHEISLGRHRYRVEIFAAPGALGAPYIAGYALNVKPSKRTSNDFTDFCASVVIGFGWEEHYQGEENLLLKQNGKITRMWTASSTASIPRILLDKRRHGDSKEIIITNQTVSKNLRSLSDSLKCDIIHYSQIERWMKSRNYDTSKSPHWLSF